MLQLKTEIPEHTSQLWKLVLLICGVQLVSESRSVSAAPEPKLVTYSHYFTIAEMHFNKL